MKNIAKFAFAASTLTALFAPTLASAQDDERRGRLTGIGMGAAIGGGVTGFTDSEVRDATAAGGSWTARLLIGSRTMFGFETAYIGTAQDVAALGLDTDAVLVSNGIEGALRLNLLVDAPWQPYVFAGLAWKHYDVVNASFNTSSLLESDDVGEVPAGLGLAYRDRGFMFDVRAEIRPAWDGEMFDATSIEDNSMMTWNAGARLGFEF